MSEIELLSSVPIFSDLQFTDLEELHSRMSIRKYEKNDIILMEDEFGDTLFIINKGSIKITRVSEDGREVILAILGEGEFLVKCLVGWPNAFRERHSSNRMSCAHFEAP